MKTSKILKIATVAFGLIAGSAVFAAGDVYEIRRCDENGTTIVPTESAEQPLDAGKTYYFKLRLVPRTAGGNPWRLGWVSSSGSRIVDDALHPPRIGIYVSGQLCWAEYVDELVDIDSTSRMSEFIFKYTPLAGDYALPIVLATEGGPADEVSDSQFLMDPVRAEKWAFVDTDATDASGRTVPGTYNVCNLWLWSESPGYYEDMISAETRETDYTLSNAQLFARTVGFNETWEQDGTLWRSVHEGSTQTVGARPSLVSLAGTLAHMTELYVWSDNEDAVKVVGDSVVTMTNDFVAGTPQLIQRSVKKIKLSGDKPFSFDISGVLNGGTANLYLSAYPHFRFAAAGHQRLTDYVTVPVKCIEPLPVSIVIERDDASVIAPTAADEAYLTAVTSFVGACVA